MSNEKQIVVAGETLAFPSAVAAIIKSNGTKMNKKQYLCAQNGIDAASVKKVKMSALVERVGKDKAKAQLKTFAVSLRDFYVHSAKVTALASADPDLRKDARILFSKKGEYRGINTMFRYVNAPKMSAAAATIAELRAENEALKQAALNSATA